jgi:uncharacterized membrane protein
MYSIEIYFLLFIIYSILGWTMEVLGKLIQYKRFINRGFLIGPYCPIYGTGAILITFLLQKYTNDIVILFCMAILICGILEYITSFLMEKIFKARWWDYSNRKFNINGRVCLYTIIPFGILGCLIMYVLNPFFLGVLYQIPQLILTVIFWIMLIIFLTDNIISFNIISYVRTTTKKINTDFKFDNTEEITRKVKEILTNRSVLHRRLMNAYPKINAIKQKIKEKRKK